MKINQKISQYGEFACFICFVQHCLSKLKPQHSRMQIQILKANYSTSGLKNCITFFSQVTFFFNFWHRLLFVETFSNYFGFLRTSQSEVCVLLAFFQASKYIILSRSLAILFKLKPVLPQNALLQLYYAMVYPYLIYGLVAWGQLSLLT